MKPYLYAPIAIAGVLTFVGTASILTAEVHLVKAGRAAVSLLRRGSDQSADLDLRQLDATNFDRAASTQMPSNMVLDWRGTPTSPEAPVVNLSMQPVPKKASHPHRASLRLAPRAVPAPRVFANLPHGALASTYTLRNVATSKPSVKGETVWITPDGKHSFVSIPHLPKECSNASKVQFVFDSKKFELQQKELAANLKTLRAESWKEGKEELKKLGAYQIAFQVPNSDTGTERHVITIDPLELAAAAEKAGVDAANTADGEMISTSHD